MNSLHEKSKYLNLGSGWYPKDGYINLDCNPNYPVDIIHDLNIIPWPFPDSSFSRIEMDHLLEHLDDIRHTMSELYRILEPGGVLVIRVPHFSRGFTHWDHKRGFDISFPIYFDSSESGAFEEIPLEHLSTKLTWFAQPHMKKKHLNKFLYLFGYSLGKLFDFIGNINLFFTSRLLCYWVGGYDEIEFIFEKTNT